MVGHGFDLDDVALTFGADLADDLLEPSVHGSFDDGSPVLSAPHDVIDTPVDDVVVGSDFSHTGTI